MALSREDKLKLEELEIKYRVNHLAGNKGVLVEMIDARAKGRPVIATGRGDDLDTALKDGMKNAMGADRPKTAGELASENQALKAKIAELTAARGESTSTQPTVNGTATNTTGVDDQDEPEPASPGTPAETSMSDQEIVAALKSRHLDIPDRRNKGWQDVALKSIEAHDAEKASK